MSSLSIAVLVVVAMFAFMYAVHSKTPNNTRSHIEESIKLAAKDADVSFYSFVLALLMHLIEF